MWWQCRSIAKFKRFVYHLLHHRRRFEAPCYLYYGLVNFKILYTYPTMATNKPIVKAIYIHHNLKCMLPLIMEYVFNFLSTFVTFMRVCAGLLYRISAKAKRDSALDI